MLLTTAKVVITYDHLVVSYGGGMDASAGTFTAPAAGTYEFGFQASYRGTAILRHPRLRKNGKTVEDFVADTSDASEKYVMSVRTTLALDVGDTVDVYFPYAPYVYIDSWNEFIHFYGVLLF